MKNFKIIFVFLFSPLFLFFFLCVTPSLAQEDTLGVDYIGEYNDEDWEDDYEEVLIEDPFESYNRFIFQFNDKVYTYLFNPLSKGYDFLVPKKIQSSIDNISSNIRTPIRLFNCLFQGKFKEASRELRRFAINTTIGIGGVFDPAKAAFKMEKQAEDFDQTLGYHGVKTGPYIMWPFIGPSTRRATIAFPFDVALNPTTWLGVYEVEPEDAFIIFSNVRRVNNYSYRVRDNYDALIDRAIDPYVALKHAYIHNRRKKIAE